MKCCQTCFPVLSYILLFHILKYKKKITPILDLLGEKEY